MKPSMGTWIVRCFGIGVFLIALGVGAVRIRSYITGEWAVGLVTRYEMTMRLPEGGSKQDPKVPWHAPWVTFRTQDGNEHEILLKTHFVEDEEVEFPLGSDLALLYDPKDPARTATLYAGYFWVDWVGFLVAGVVIFWMSRFVRGSAEQTPPASTP